MQGLWILTRVSDDKRHEMVQSLSAFRAEQAMRPHRRFVLQVLDDENLVAWLGYWRHEEGLDRFLASATFRAIKGAADTLGHLEEIQRLNVCSLLPFPSARTPKEVEDAYE